MIESWEHGAEVTREEVATYLLAVELSKSGVSFHIALDRLRGMATDEMWSEFEEKLGHSHNRAKDRLKEDHYRWFKRVLPLGTLWLRGESKSTVQERARKYRETPEEQRSEELRRYAPRKIPPELAIIVVHQEERSPHNTCIGDGYHRAVSLFLQEERDVRTYSGEFTMAGSTSPMRSIGR